MALSAFDDEAAPPGDEASKKMLGRAARSSRLPAPALAVIDAAPSYAEGRGIRMPVRKRGDVETVLKLVTLKLGKG